MKEEDLKTLARFRMERARSPLHDARNLLESGGSAEGVINRSCYAMFYAVLALFQHEEKVPRKHSGIIGLFDREFYKTGVLAKELSKDLHRAFELRQKSDYQELVTIHREVAEDLFRKARDFVNAVSEYLNRGVTKNHEGE